VRGAFDELYERADSPVELIERRLHLVTAELPEKFSGYEQTAAETGLIVLCSRPLTDLVGLNSQFFTLPQAV
jgi:hypothetical protein